MTVPLRVRETPAAEVVVETQPQNVTRLGQRRRWQGRLATVASALIVLVMMVPFVWALLTAIKPFNVAFANPPVWQFNPTTKAFSQLWSTTSFSSILTNTIEIAVCSVLVSLLLAAPAAYALARMPGPVSALLLVAALVFRAVPQFAFLLPFYNISRAVGIYDTKLVVILAIVAVNQPFTLWLLRNFFADIPVEIEESAMIDGCSRFRAFRRIVLPLARPGLVTAGIFTFLLAFQEYVIPLALTQNRAVTIPVFVGSLSTAQSNVLFQVVAAASVVLAAPIIVIAFFAEKHLVSGLVGGAVKG